MPCDDGTGMAAMVDTGRDNEVQHRGQCEVLSCRQKDTLRLPGA